MSDEAVLEEEQRVETPAIAEEEEEEVRHRCIGFQRGLGSVSKSVGTS